MLVEAETHEEQDIPSETHLSRLNGVQFLKPAQLFFRRRSVPAAASERREKQNDFIAGNIAGVVALHRDCPLAGESNSSLGYLQVLVLKRGVAETVTKRIQRWYIEKAVPALTRIVHTVLRCNRHRALQWKCHRAGTSPVVFAELTFAQAKSACSCWLRQSASERLIMFVLITHQHPMTSSVNDATREPLTSQHVHQRSMHTHIYQPYSSPRTQLQVVFQRETYLRPRCLTHLPHQPVLGTWNNHATTASTKVTE